MRLENSNLLVRLLDVVPDAEETLVAQLNALTRIVAYFAILCALGCNVRVAAIACAFAVVLAVVAHRAAAKSLAEAAAEPFVEGGAEIATDVFGQECVAPTRENPFMNPPVYDTEARAKFHDRPACSLLDPRVDEAATRLAMTPADDDLPAEAFMDLEDVFDRHNAARQFYSVPDARIPNDRDAFAKWVYLRSSNKPYGEIPDH